MKYIIKNKEGETVLKKDGSCLVFKYPIQAYKYLQKYYNNSKYLKIHILTTKLIENYLNTAYLLLLL